MQALFLLPTDRVAHSWAEKMREEGWSIEKLHAFGAFVKQSRTADFIILNYSKTDAPRYIPKIFLSVLYARLVRTPVYLFMSIDPVDLCDRWVLRAMLYAVNFVLVRLATCLIVIHTRTHIPRRYFVSMRKVHRIANCPQRDQWTSFAKPDTAARSDGIRFFYHGELLWWHGLERFAPILDAVKQHIPASMTVAGNLYPTHFKLFGLPASRKEIRIKKQLRAFLDRPDVTWLGRVDLDRVKVLMADADFHVTQLNATDTQGDTELRTCLLEAMAAGMICLHVDSSAIQCPEFRDRHNLVIIDPTKPKEAAQKILEIYASLEVRQQISESARRTVEEHFGLATDYAKLRQVILKQLGGLRSPRARTDPEQPMKHPSPIVLTIDAVLRPLGVLIYLAIAAVSYPIVSFFWPRHRTRRILKTDVSRPSAKLGEVVPPAEHPPAEHLPAEAWPSVSVVVPAFNSQETIAACIESLLNLQYPREKLEIIIVDNGSSDDTAAIASRYPVRVLSEEQRGAAAARNRGIREAGGEYVAFTDSDCQVAPDWLTRLVRTAEENKSDAVGGRIVNAVSTPIARFTEDQRVMNQEDAIRGALVPLPFIITANALFKKKILDVMDGFDVAFDQAAAEDNDLGWRLHARGCVFAYAHDAIVYHHHRLSAAGLYFQFFKYSKAEVQLFMKHRSRLSLRELRSMLWIRGWAYRRFMKCLVTLPWCRLVDPERARYNWLYLVREMGFMAGRLHGNWHFRTFRYFSFW